MKLFEPPRVGRGGGGGAWGDRGRCVLASRSLIAHVVLMPSSEGAAGVR